CVSNDLWRKTVSLETDIRCLHRRNLRPTQNAGNSKPVNVTTPCRILGARSAVALLFTGKDVRYFGQRFGCRVAVHSICISKIVSICIPLLELKPYIGPLNVMRKAMPSNLINEDNYIEISGLCDATIHLKVEGLNPAGSIKLKTAISIIRALELEKRIKGDTYLIESSSGNLGVALAMVCAQRGHKFVCVIDPNTSSQNRKLISAMGAQVITVEEKDENGGYLNTRIQTIKDIVSQNPNYIWLNQYKNPENPRAHFNTTAKSISDRFSRIDYLFVGAGTTGTLMGCNQFFAKHRPETKVVAVDSVGSVTFGLPAGSRYIPGLGTSRKPEIFDPTGLHSAIHIPELQTIQVCRWLAKSRGFLAGGSTGTVLAAIYEWRGRLDRDDVVVAISPDMGERYLDTIYSDDWVADRFGEQALVPFLETHLTTKVA
ncbi:2,3-diaminopropionate biosynthesis protein SbnA, partial [Agrobacterium vitis]|uniref:2,3-diaminopropionate biosynthesis protein SbnA n=1 Tax=Agrobacterium vitis TaxID=373 RepID=UPI001AED54C1